MDALQIKPHLEDLFYLLSGFDTSSVFISNNPPILVSGVYSESEMNLFKPFEFLIFKIREFFSLEQFDRFVQKYLEKVASLRATVKSFEEMFVLLQEDIETFKDLSKIQIIFKSPENFLFNCRKKEFFNVKPSIIKTYQTQEAIELLICINRWVNQADPTHLVDVLNPVGFNLFYWDNLFKIKSVDLPRKELEGIEEAGKVVFFARVFFGIELVDDENLVDAAYDNVLNAENNNALNTGINQNVKTDLEYNKKVKYGTNINTNSFKQEPQEYSTLDRKNSNFSTYKDTDNIVFLGNEDLDSIQPGNSLIYATQSKSNRNKGTGSIDITNGIQNTPTEIILQNTKNEIPLDPFYYKNCIKPRRDILVKLISGLMSSQLKIEIFIIENVVMCQNCTFFASFLDNFRNDIFTSENHLKSINSYFQKTFLSQSPIKGISKIGIKTFNNSNFVAFNYCDNTLGSYVMKLLKFQKEPQENPYLTNFQKLGISFEDSLLQYFIPERTFVEMKILFRFFFLVNSSIYYIQESKTYNFTKVIYLIFSKIKEQRIDLIKEFFTYKPIDNSTQLTEDFSIDSFTSEFANQISELLNKFYLTCPEVFPFWSNLLDIAHEFLIIEYKECILVSDFNIKVKECVLGMIQSIQKNYGENSITEFLKNLEVEKYL